MDEAIPQYHVGHRELVDSTNSLISNSKLKNRFFIAGNSYYGVGVPSTILASRYVADNVVKAIG